MFLFKRYKQLGSFVIMFIPLVHDRLALNPSSFTIEFDSLETAPNGYVNVFG